MPPATIADQQVAGVRDRGVGEHALDVRCVSASTLPTVIVAAANHHSTTFQSALPAARLSRNTRAKAAKAAAFTPTAMNAVTDVGAPS